MNRKEFLEELYMALSRLPEEERKNALTYYNEYLDDAGEENEAEALEELGSIREIASRINAEFAIREMEEHPKSAAKSLSAVWIVLIAIFATPIAVPLALAFLGLAAAMIMVAVAVLLSIWAVALSGVVAGLCLIFGIFFVVEPLTMSIIIMVIGVGLAAIGLGILLGIFAYWITKVTFCGIAYLFHGTLRKIKEKKKK